MPDNHIPMLEASSRLRLDTDLTLDHVEQVVSIVSSSRAGSSLVKYVLGLHPDISTLAGECEPYYKLTHNGYPWHTCDVFRNPNNVNHIRLLMANELYNHEQPYNRRLLQSLMIEEPPFIEPKVCRLTPTLLLKTPQNIYRRGVIERLLPGRRVTYLYLTRGFAQVVNGLIDGWIGNDYKARKTDDGWWKFDMPPGWDFCDLNERCYYQWRMANLFGLGEYRDAMRIKFEQFIDNPNMICRDVFNLLGLRPFRVPPVDRLPLIGSTKTPIPYRWRGRVYLAAMFSHAARPIMQSLNYSMDQDTWV